MSCYHPISGYRGPGGKIQTKAAGAWIHRRITLPCKQCAGCRLDYRRQWAIRALHEDQEHDRSCFITLTYDDEHLPENDSLVLEDWQNFAKKLRRDVGRFRFLMCGEYGDQTGRPHFHALIFGHDFREDRKLYRRKPSLLYSSATLTQIWGRGEHNPIGDVTFESSSYVAGYIMKKVNGRRKAAHYGRVIDMKTGEERYIRKPEFMSCSRRPGLAAAWLERNKDQVYPRDEIISRGRRVRPPAFYDRRIERENPEMFEEVKEKRRLEGRRYIEDNTKERLKTREEIANKQRQERKRSKV